MSRLGAVLGALGAFGLLVACQHASRSEAAHGEGSPERKAIDSGKRVPRSPPPITTFDLYLDAFHVMKDDPSRSMEAHHYCQKLSADLTQCVLFDSNGAGARMNGVEYIVSERAFEALPPEERRLWHPHNYEILSGQLIAPALSDVAEKQLLSSMMNSYGKTWHFWRTPATTLRGDPLPMGAPELAWSFNADGEIPQALLTRRDIQLGVNTVMNRRRRADLVPMAHPQEGVDALAPAFPRRRPIEGVVDVLNAGK